MANIIYKDEKSLESIDDVLKLADEALEKEHIVITEKKSVPPSIALAFGGTAGAGLGALGLGTVGATVGTTGVASLAAGGTAAIGGLALLPFIAPVAILGGIGYLLFQSKKEKELHNKKLARYKEAVSKQNKIIRKFMDLDKKRADAEKILKKENQALRDKIRELMAINEALLKIIENLGSDLQPV